MADFLIAASWLLTGLVLMGAVWLAYDLRRRQRDIGDRMDIIDTRNAAQKLEALRLGEVTADLERRLRQHADALYDHGKDLDTLAEATSTQRYTRGKKD